MNTCSGRYKVTGTHYYHDNRIEGNIYKEDKYDNKPDRRELKDMLKDRRFAIEVEVSKLNDALLQEESHPKQRGTKV
uniref:Transposase n=1 Tax=Heterorhabditis bacteriophora TaxID=37862 RepID=A0A1I7XNY4_HETBA